MTLWPWPLTFWSWECFVYSASHVLPTYQFSLSYDYRLLKYELLNLITFPLSNTVNAHTPCHVTYHRGAKMVHISEIFDPNLPIHFVTFRALRWRLSHVICENGVYSIVKAKKFIAHAQYHVTCAQGVPQNHTWQFFDPQLSVHYTSFMGLRRRLRVVLY